jgi:hypothetical protein
MNKLSVCSLGLIEAWVSETKNIPILFTFLSKKALFSTLE